MILAIKGLEVKLQGWWGCLVDCQNHILNYTLSNSRHRHPHRHVHYSIVSTAGPWSTGGTGTVSLSTMPSPGELNLPTSPPDTAAPVNPALAGGVDTPWRSVMNRTEERETGAVSTQPDAGGAHAELPAEIAKKGKKVQYEPFALAGSLPMILAHLVEKILKGQYVDLSDLIQDNILLAKKSASSSGTSQTESGLIQRYKKREFTKDEAGMLSWIQCFAVYTAVVCSQDPSRFNDLLGYMVTIINEGRRFKYQGWLTYDEMFRQSVVKSKSTSWSELNGTLYATTFLSQQKGESVTCQTCSSPDHYTNQCALNECKPRYRPPSPPRRKRQQSRSPERAIYYAWNDGKCSRGYSCKFKHMVCLKCGGEHRAVQCIAYKKK